MAPENTLVAIARAAASGVDMVEVDLQGSKDGALVLMHDTTLARTTDVGRHHRLRARHRVGSFALAELRRLDAGSWHGPRYAGEPVPTLEEALDLAAALEVGVLLELKHPRLYPGVVDDLAAALARWADQVNPEHRAADVDYVRHVRDAGMQCLVWTVDGHVAQRRAIRSGVDGVITNCPEWAAPGVFGRARGEVSPSGIAGKHDEWNLMWCSPLSVCSESWWRRCRAGCAASRCPSLSWH